MNDWLDGADNDNPTGFWTTVLIAGIVVGIPWWLGLATMIGWLW